MFSSVVNWFFNRSPTAPAAPQSGYTYKRVYVETASQAEDACGRLQGARRVGVDCEGVDLCRDGRLCLVQVADPRSQGGSPTAFVFDIVALGGVPQGLRELLEDEQVEKVFHDVRQDSDALYHQFGVRLKSVLDTQLCHAAVRRHCEGEYPPHVKGLRAVLEAYLPRLLAPDAAALKLAVSSGFQRDPRLWERRPLPEHLLRYAANDVALLVPLYERLESALEAEECEISIDDVVRASGRYAAAFRDRPRASRGRENAVLDAALFN